MAGKDLDDLFDIFDKDPEIIDIEDLSKDIEDDEINIDPNGENVPENTNYIFDYVNSLNDGTIINPSNFTNEFKMTENTKCPVGIIKNANSDNLIIIANVFDVITDINDYIDYIDILNIMREGDICYTFFDTPGGAISTGARLASCIKHCKGTVNTVAWGTCASCGSLMWSAGKNCYCSDFALFMYHMSSHMDYGNSYAIMNRASSMVKYVQQVLLNTALQKGHITEEEHKLICSDKEEEVYINAKTMKDRLMNKGV